MTPPDVSFVELADATAIAQYLPQLATAYTAIFEGAPYFESFENGEALDILSQHFATQGHISVVALVRGRVAGFAVSVPLRARPDIGRELAGLVPDKHTHYLAEMGVLPAFRGLGLGSRLVSERIKRVDAERFSHVVLRIAEGNNLAYQLYQELGFTNMGVYMDVSAKRTDGTVRKDRRVFFSRVLSQVDID